MLTTKLYVMFAYSSSFVISCFGIVHDYALSLLDDFPTYCMIGLLFELPMLMS